MSSDRRHEQDFGAYRVKRTWLGCWRWRVTERLGAGEGLRLSRAAAKSAARQHLRELSFGRKPLDPAS